MDKYEDADPHTLEFIEKLNLKYYGVATNFGQYNDIKGTKYIDGEYRQITLDLSRSYQKRRDYEYPKKWGGETPEKDRNYIELYEEMFDNFPYLKDLDLSYNEIEEIPDGLFDNLDRLDYLNLGFNNINKLPNGIFDNLKNLTILHLRNNNLEKLDSDTFASLEKLDHLRLSFNPLEALPDQLFANNSKLRLVFLNDCLLKTLPETLFANMPILKKVNLSNNQFTQFFPLKLHKRATSIEIVLTKNPIQTRDRPVNRYSSYEWGKDDVDYLLPYILAEDMNEAKAAVEKMVRKNVYNDQFLHAYVRMLNTNLSDDEIQNLLEYINDIQSSM